MRTIAAVTWFGMVIAGASAFAADYEPGTPFAYLFDTNTNAAAAMEPAVVAAKKGWLVLAEDELKHEFHGDAVLLNDKLVVVLRREGPGAEVYAHGPAGLKYRATVAPRAGQSAATSGIKALRTIENGPSAVLIEAVFRTAGGSDCALKYRLTTGQGLLEVRAGENTKQVAVDAAAAWAVVPDFFGDDAVLGAASVAQPRLGMPAENFFLTLADGGNAMLMCVWPSARQRAELAFSAGSSRAIAGFTIDAPEKPDQPLWLAFLEGQNLWQERAIAAGAAADLQWKPAFPAKWRGDFVGVGVLASSWQLRGSVAGNDEAEPAEEGCPCRLDGDRLRVQFEGKTAQPPPEKLLIYPIDRSRATPLTVFCPIDILRSTLGVGPCQYILQTEGLTSETNPTPDSVMKWVEQQFSKKKEKRAAEEIRGLLAQMVEHVGHAQQRIARYAAAIGELRAMLPMSGNQSTAAMAATLDYLDRTLAAAGREDPRAKVSQLGTQVVDLIGREGAAIECRRLGVEIRRVGSIQDSAMSRARMGLRWLREQARQTVGAEKLGSRVNEALQGR